MLSHHEQRRLAEIERELEHDPTLTKLASRLALRRPYRRRSRTGRVAWWIAVVLEIGALSWVGVGLATKSQLWVVAGLVSAVVIGIPVVGVATGSILDRHRNR